MTQPSQITMGANAAAEVRQITVSGPDTLQSGQQAPVNAVAQFDGGTTMDVTAEAAWHSENADVCSFASPGTLVATSAGSCSISAKYQQTSGQFVIAVQQSGSSGPSDVVSLSVSGTSSLIAGAVAQWSAVATMSDGSQQSVTGSALWTSQSPAVASVSSGGVVSAKSAGTTAISVYYGGHSASAPVTVSEPGPRTLTGLSISGSTSIGVGQTSQLQATAQYSDGSSETVTTQAIWSSSSPTVATVAAGLVTGLTAGITTISASYSGQTAQTTVTVSSSPPTLVSLSISGNTNVKSLATSQLVATAHYSDGSTQIVTTLSVWTSSNPASATVAAGLVVGATPGSSTITATYGGQTAQVTVTVTL